MPLLLAMLFAFCWFASIPLIKDEEAGYSINDRRAMEQLVASIPESAKPVKLWTPKNECERGMMIARIWNIEAKGC